MASPGPPHTAGEGSQETLRPGDLKPETLLPGTLNPAQLEGLKEVLSFRQWWKDYDRMTKGTGDTGGGLEDNPDVSLLPSLEPGVFLEPSVYLVAWLVLMAAALVALVWLMCSRSSRSRRGSSRRRSSRRMTGPLPLGTPQDPCQRTTAYPRHSPLTWGVKAGLKEGRTL